MSADTEFHMTAADLRKRLVQLRSVTDQGDDDFPEDRSLLEHIFTEDELEWIEEEEPILFGILERIQDQWEAMQDANDELELTQASADAMVFVLAIQEEGGDDEASGGDRDPDRDLDADPDADLG